MQQEVSFYNITPRTVLETAERAGFHTTGEFYQLNSYENRVFDIRLEGGEAVIAKFYRPHRWSLPALMDEHEFLWELKDEGIHAVAPLILPSGSTLIDASGIHVAFFPKVRGRMPQEFLGDDLKKVGRLLARVHNVGAQHSAPDRPVMDSSHSGGWDTLDFLESWISPEMRPRYVDAASTIISAIDRQIDPSEFIRIHGDCHKGNLLQTGAQGSDEYFLVDFDDCLNGPVIQDFWMLFNGDKDTFDHERDLILAGYEELREFPWHQFDWIDLLRGQRIISYAGWIAKRWEDPSFPRIFPEFNTYRYWAEEVEALERIAWSLK